MNKTLKKSSAADEDEKVIMSGSGKKYRRLYQDLLDNMPQDIVKEMARRRLEDIALYQKQRES
ncbi:hypothetical protein FACS189447_11060 [Spirochaetia bacterium]|nr:hypothetical protein FACS189447_11060 [Spirochaetia bacterium]